MTDITSIILVNACDVLSDADVAASVPAFQAYDDTVLRPAWSLAPCQYSFMPWDQFKITYSAEKGLVWPVATAPLFFNRHSSDPGALGWHEDDLDSIFGRVFVGDDLAYGVSPWVDASHEACETRVDPLTDRTVLPKEKAMPDPAPPAQPNAQAALADLVYIQARAKELIAPFAEFVPVDYETDISDLFNKMADAQAKVEAILAGAS